MTYNLSDSFNSSIALIVGVLFATLAYVLIYPPDAKAALRYVTYRVRRGLELISLLHPVPESSSHWETRMYDRVMRLNDPQNPAATPTDEWLDAGLGALNLGNEILRLRRWLESGQLSGAVRTAAANVIDRFGHFLPEPQRAIDTVKEQIQKLSLIDPGIGQPERLSWARVQGALQEIDVYLAENPRLTRSDGGFW